MPEDLNLDRRAILGNIALLIGASSLPASALAAPQKQPAAIQFLARSQFALLTAVADTILPKTDSVGALDALVPIRLDALLKNWASVDTRTQITGALDRIDAAARAQMGKPFVTLTGAERETVLKPYDSAALKPVPALPNAPKPLNPFMQQTFVVDQGYLTLKALVIDLFYYSGPAAEKELIYEHVPGEYEPSITLTATSRPYLGTGPF